jgi:hypothetical protein
MSKRILDLQTRFTEAGRIRLGERRGNRPSKIDKLRFTSPSLELIQQIGTLYGGEVTSWESPRGPESQVYIERDEIDIIIPPSDEALTTSYELWSASGMQKYCDGSVMKRPGSDDEYPCECKSLAEQTCKIKARMIVWLPRIQTLGVWRLETGSWYAAGELTRMVDLLLDASEQLRKAVSAKLRLDKRVVKREGKTFNFNVPIITPVGDVAVVLEAMTPMTALPSARDVQLRPEAPLALPAPETTKWPSDAPENLEGHVPNESEAVVQPTKGKQAEDAVIDKGKHTQLMITLGAINFTDDERHDLVRHVTGGRTESSKELTFGDMPAIWKRATSRATIEVQKIFSTLWSEPQDGWDALRKVDGLDKLVKDWKLNEWLIALDYCDVAQAKMLEDSEVQG